MQTQSSALVVQFAASDKELRAEIDKALGDVAVQVHRRQFDAGMLDVVQFILPVVPQTVKFLLDHFSKPHTGTVEKRVLITKRGDIRLEGYSVKEITTILEDIKT
jgi:hypothetical protein